MQEKDFFDRFIGLLENTKSRYDLENIHDALIVWFGEHYLGADASEVAERIVRDSHAEGIDSVLTDATNYNLVIVQAKTVEHFDRTRDHYPESDVKKTLEGLRLLLRGDYKGKITSELENLIDEYHELDKTGDYKTVVIFISLKKVPAENKFIENFKKDFPQIEVRFYDFDWLLNFYVNTYLKSKASPPERISFEVLHDKVLIKEAPTKSTVFTCRGKELARIYNDNRERIFQQNVRFSLGLKSKRINSKILETAINPSRSKDFWYFNNGITIICKRITLSTSGKVINLDGAQIVNGAQTTYALHEAYQDGTLKDEVEVLIKAIETEDSNFVENVTLYTNSQNAIRLRDLSSNDPIQLEIQKILLGTYNFFYEIKRGEFDSLYPTVDSKRNLLGDGYRVKVISNENAAQSFLAMFLNKPSQAKSDKGRIFMKDEAGFYDSIFNNNDSLVAEKILMSWTLLKRCEDAKRVYRRTYFKIAEDLPEAEKTKIYKYDFVLHGEYFIINLLRDFLRNDGLEIDSNKDHIIKLIFSDEETEKKIKKSYQLVVETLADLLEDIRKEPGYYHNKFFKNEKSIALIRYLFKNKYNFVDT